MRYHSGNILFHSVILLFFSMSLVFGISVVYAAPQVVTVPAQGQDPTIPHPAYRGHATTFKAIARGTSSSNVYFRWDFDGDGIWDQGMDRGSWDYNLPSGPWYYADAYSLDCRQVMVGDQNLHAASGVMGIINENDITAWPGGRKIYIATLEVSENPGSGGPSYYASFPVLVHGLVQRWNFNGVIIDAHMWFDTDEDLEIKRSVTVEDAMWAQHKLLVRSNKGMNTLTAYPADPDTSLPRRIGSAATMLWGLCLNGHYPAYPPGTYQDSPSNPAYVPPHFSDYGTHYDLDPYTEDAAALLNWLILNLSSDASGGYSVGGNTISTYSNMHMGELLGAFSEPGILGTYSQVAPMGSNPRETIDSIIGKFMTTVEYRQSQCGCNPGYPETDWHCMRDGGWNYMTQTTCSSDSDVLGEAISFLAPGLFEAYYNASAELSNAAKGRLTNAFWINTKHHNQYVGSGSYSNNYRMNNSHQPNWTAGLISIAALLGIEQMEPFTNCTQPFSNMKFTTCDLRQNYDLLLEYLGKAWEFNGTGDVGWISGTYQDQYARFGLNSAGNIVAQGRGNLENIFLISTALKNVGEATIAHYPNVVAPAPDDPAYRWYSDIISYSVNSQSTGGSIVQNWCTSSAWGCPALSMHAAFKTSWGITIPLATYLVDKPTALGERSPFTVTEGCAGSTYGNVTFTHSESYHANPNRSITTYQWDFDTSDGLWWDTLDPADFQTSNPAQSATHQYMYSGTYTAALRVIDDGGAFDIIMADIVVLQSANVAPSAEAGGPYSMLEGQNLQLNGSGSDPNEDCGDTLTYHWDLNDDAVYNDATGEASLVPWSTLEPLGLALDVPLTISLMVIDSHGLINSDSATLTIQPDADHDSIIDDEDNCPTDSNPLQEDEDEDDVGDVCDNCPQASNPSQVLSSIGDRIWFDDDGDGIQDITENGMAGIAAYLYDDEFTYLATAVSDAAGDFSFTDLCPADYYIAVFPPLGFSFSDIDQGSDDTLDNDIDPATGFTNAITVGENQTIAHVDAGIRAGCTGPDEPVWISILTLSDPEEYPIIHYQDPNQYMDVTGYNIYRSDDASEAFENWDLVASNVIDMDETTPNNQWTDSSGDDSPTGVWYYQVTAYSSLCDVEGPL